MPVVNRVAIGFGVRRVRGPLALHVAAVEEQPGGAVLLDVRRAERLREQPQPAAPPQVDLEQPVAGGVEALRDEDVVGGLGVQVRDPPLVDDELHRPFEARECVRLGHDRAVRRSSVTPLILPVLTSTSIAFPVELGERGQWCPQHRKGRGHVARTERVDILEQAEQPASFDHRHEVGETQPGAAYLAR